MHQIITKPNQNICCLPIIDIEEKFKSSTNENIEVADKDEITNFEQNDTSEVSENTENKTDITVKDKQSFIPKAFICLFKCIFRTQSSITIIFCLLCKSNAYFILYT